MAIPDSNCASPIETGDTCGSTWKIGERIRSVAFEGMCSCDCGTPYLSHTVIGSTIQEPLGNSLVIAMTEFGPRTTTSAGSLPPVATHAARYLLQLRDNGWPTIQTDENGAAIHVPTSEEFNHASFYAQEHGEQMYRRLVNAIQMRTLFAGASNGHIISESIAMSNMTPLGPQAIQVGWQITIVVPLRL